MLEVLKLKNYVAFNCFVMEWQEQSCEIDFAKTHNNVEQGENEFPQDDIIINMHFT